MSLGVRRAKYEAPLTVSVDIDFIVDTEVELADQQPLEAQQQVQRRRAFLAVVLGLQIVGDAQVGNVLQSGDGLRRDIPAR